MTTNNFLNLEEKIEDKSDESNEKNIKNLQSSWDKINETTKPLDSVSLSVSADESVKNDDYVIVNDEISMRNQFASNTNIQEYKNLKRINKKLKAENLKLIDQIKSEKLKLNELKNKIENNKQCYELELEDNELLRKNAEPGHENLEIEQLRTELIDKLKDENKRLTDENIKLKKEILILQSKYDAIHIDFQSLRKDHDQINMENNILRSQSFAFDLKNNLFDHFIYSHMNDKIFGRFIEIKRYADETELKKIDLNAFFRFCNTNRQSKEYEQINLLFIEFINKRMNLKNREDFTEMKGNINKNQSTHEIEYDLEDYNLNLKDFLKVQEPNLENLDSEVKKKYIDQILNSFRVY